MITLDQTVAILVGLGLTATYGGAAVVGVVAGEAKLIGIGFALAADRAEHPARFWSIVIGDAALAVGGAVVAVRFAGWLG